MKKAMRIATYLRLSQEDGLEGESLSITGQRELIKNYLERDSTLAAGEVVEFIDDGYTGTNFNRPAMIRLLDEVKDGAIQCIVVKDLSRFGRNYLQVGDYLEHIFPALKVRFVAINDGYDSNKYKDRSADMDVPFRNLMYDAYSKDVSRKVLSSKQMKMKNGEFTSPYAPYGYLKDPCHKNKLLIEEVTAKIVKRIFQEVLEGKKPTEIAKGLNADDVPTPMAHKRKKGVSRAFNNGCEQNVWTKGAVRRIINDERYTGAFVGGKKQNRIANDKKLVALPKSEWVVIDKALPAIVGTEVFEQVQALTCRQAPAQPRKSNPNRIFSKKIRCEGCGLLYARKEQRSSYYYCATAKMGGERCCHGKIYESDLAKKILLILQKQLAIEVNVQGLLKQERERVDVMVEKQEGQVRMLESKITTGNDYKNFSLYESYQTSVISREEYLRKKSVIEQEMQAAQKTLENARIILMELQERRNLKCELLNILGENFLPDALTKELVDRLISEILVEREGDITVRFSYQNPSEKIK